MRFNEFRLSKTHTSVMSLFETHLINEVNMSPSALRDFMTSELGKTATAGFEMELEFPDENFLSGDPGEPEEIDDEDIQSTEHIVRFFYNDGSSALPRSEIVDLAIEWTSGQIDEHIDQNRREYIEEYVDLHKDDSYFREELEDHIEDIVSTYGLYSSLPSEFKTADGGDDDDDIKLDYSSELTDYIVQNHEEEIVDYIYDNYDNFEPVDEYAREAAWEKSEDIIGEKTMLDFFNDARWSNQYLEWPVDYENYDPEGSVRDYSDLIYTFLSETDGYGYPAKQDATGDYTVWNFEFDTSLDENTGVEIISPAMSLSQAVEIIPKIFEWAKDNGAANDKQTGFHMSVSFPHYSIDNLDFIKMALFLGDRHVLDTFGRYGNEMTKPVISHLSNYPVSNMLSALDTLSIDKTFDSLGEKLNAAAKVAVNRSWFDKFVSIHPKSNIVEIRSAGGTKYLEQAEEIQNAIIRYAYALSIALNPQAEVKEYAKKLYTFLTSLGLTSASGIDITKLFTLYSVGQIDKQSLVKYIEMAADKDHNNHSTPMKRESVFVVTFENPVVQNISDLPEKFSFSTKEPFQNVKHLARMALKNFIDKHDTGDITFKDKSGNTIKFDPMNKRHLPDNQIVMTKVSNYY